MRPIYISSNAFSDKSIDKILNFCADYGIEHLELGSGVAHDPDARKKIVAAAGTIKIILHNYIPAPQIPFVLNLSSQDREALKKSKNLVLEALEISSEIKAPFFAVHSGFSYFAEPGFLGGRQSHLKHFPMAEAEKIFEESIFELADKAKTLEVKLLIENNVIPRSNLINGENRSYLVADTDNSLYFLKKFENLSIGLLLDTGHLQVSARALGFDKNDYVRKLSKYVSAIHTSENDSESDQHLPLRPDSWALEAIEMFPDKTVTLEVNNDLRAALLSADIIRQIQ